MSNTIESQSEYGKTSQSDSNNALRRHTSNSQLLVLGTAAGAGVVTGLLLGSRSKNQPNLVGKVIKSISGFSPRKKVSRGFKATVGALTLSYLRHKLKNKLHLR